MKSVLLDLTLDRTEETRILIKSRAVIQEVGHMTRFTRKELVALSIIYFKLTKKQPMDRKYFRRLMFLLLDFNNDMLIDRIFSAFDRTNKLVITLDSWILGLSMFLRGSLEDKIKFCFTVYDLMGDGYIKKELMFQSLKNSIKTTPEENPEEVVKDMVEILMKKMDRDRDGRLSFEDYSQSVMENPALLEAFGYCLPPRPAAYAFMATFANIVSTMHSKDPNAGGRMKSIKKKGTEKEPKEVTH